MIANALVIITRLNPNRKRKTIIVKIIMIIMKIRFVVEIALVIIVIPIILITAIKVTIVM